MNIYWEVYREKNQYFWPIAAVLASLPIVGFAGGFLLFITVAAQVLFLTSASIALGMWDEDFISLASSRFGHYLRLLFWLFVLSGFYMLLAYVVLEMFFSAFFIDDDTQHFAAYILGLYYIALKYWPALGYYFSSAAAPSEQLPITKSFSIWTSVHKAKDITGWFGFLAPARMAVGTALFFVAAATFILLGDGSGIPLWYFGYLLLVGLFYPLLSLVLVHRGFIELYGERHHPRQELINRMSVRDHQRRASKLEQIRKSNVQEIKAASVSRFKPRSLEAVSREVLQDLAGHDYEKASRILAEFGDQLRGTFGGREILKAALLANNHGILTGLSRFDFSVDHRDDNGRTLLMEMVEKRAVQQVASLIELGADPTAEDRQGKSVLDRVSELTDLELKRRMLNLLGMVPERERVEVSTRNTPQEPLTKSSEREQTEKIQPTIEQDGVFIGLAEEIRELATAVETDDPFRFGRALRSLELTSEVTAILEELLMRLAKAGQVAFVRKLLEYGIGPNLRAKNGMPFIIELVSHSVVHHDVIRLLLRKGLSPTGRSSDGRNALHLLAANNELRDESVRERIARQLLEAGLSVNQRDRERETPLHLAVRYNHLRLARLFLRKEARVQAKGFDGETPLDIALEAGNEDAQRMLERAQRRAELSM